MVVAVVHLGSEFSFDEKGETSFGCFVLLALFREVEGAEEHVESLAHVVLFDLE